MNPADTKPDDLLPLLLEICEDALAHASLTVRCEADTVLHVHA